VLDFRGMTVPNNSTFRLVLSLHRSRTEITSIYVLVQRYTNMAFQPQPFSHAHRPSKAESPAQLPLSDLADPDLFECGAKLHSC